MSNKRKNQKQMPWALELRPRFKSDMNLCTRAFATKRDKSRTRAALKRELQKAAW